MVAFLVLADNPAFRDKGVNEFLNLVNFVKASRIARVLRNGDQNTFKALE